MASARTAKPEEGLGASAGVWGGRFLYAGGRRSGWQWRRRRRERRRRRRGSNDGLRRDGRRCDALDRDTNGLSGGGGEDGGGGGKGGSGDQGEGGGGGEGSGDGHGGLGGDCWENSKDDVGGGSEGGGGDWSGEKGDGGGGGEGSRFSSCRNCRSASRGLASNSSTGSPLPCWAFPFSRSGNALVTVTHTRNSATHLPSRQRRSLSRVQAHLECRGCLALVPQGCVRY